MAAVGRILVIKIDETAELNIKSMGNNPSLKKALNELVEITRIIPQLSQQNILYKHKTLSIAD